MPKEEIMEFKGVVSEILPNAMFRVTLENDHVIQWRLGQAKKLRQWIRNIQPETRRIKRLIQRALAFADIAQWPVPERLADGIVFKEVTCVCLAHCWPSFMSGE